MSNFVKTIRFTSLSQKIFREFREQLEELDTKYSVFFSGRTGVIFHKFHIMIAEISKMSDDEICKKFETENETRRFRHQVGTVELALKNDLGIYVVEFSDSNKSFESYDEVFRAVSKPAK